MKYILIFVGILSLWSQLIFAHDENKLGPHGGHIKMPGVYHTEIVPLTKNSVRVYLLDIDWKNPTIMNSSVDLSHDGEKTSKAKCSPDKDHYHCEFDKIIDLKLKGSLNLESKRENKAGSRVTYQLPLKLQIAHNKE